MDPENLDSNEPCGNAEKERKNIPAARMRKGNHHPQHGRSESHPKVKSLGEQPHEFQPFPASQGATAKRGPPCRHLHSYGRAGTLQELGRLPGHVATRKDLCGATKYGN